MLRSAKYIIVLLVVAIVLVACAVAATLMANSFEDNESSRYQQHESAQRVSDLSAEDQEAVSSLSVEAETFATHLPIVSIDTGGQTIPGATGVSTTDEANVVQTDTADTSTEEAADSEETVSEETVEVMFTLFSRDGANRLSDDPTVESTAQVHYRGHSSRRLDKKSYSIHLTSSDGLLENKCNLLDMGSDDEWVLNGPFLDKTLLRNYLAYNIAGQISGVAPEVRFCELFVDGEYQGVYVLTQPASKAVSRDEVFSVQGRAQTGYIVERDWNSAFDSLGYNDFLTKVYKTSIYSAVFIDYPSRTDITQSQIDYIHNDLNAIEKTLYSYDYDSLTYGYESLLDVSSFVDYFVINEFAYNDDAGRYSTFYYKSAGGKLHIGPVWDFNNAFGNAVSQASDIAGFIMPEKPFYYMLCKDEDFTTRVIERYRSLREGVLSDDYLASYIDDVIEYLGPAIERNYEVWGYSFDPALVNADNKLNPDERNPSSYEEAIEQLKRYIYQRGAWLDEYIDNLRQYSHESAVKKYN